MKYFLDTEFIEDGKTIDLISIGLVAEDGRSLYRQNVDCQFSKASDWVWRNVFPHLAHFDLRGSKACQGMRMPDSMSNARQNRCGDDCPWGSYPEIRDAVRIFLDVDTFGKPEIWGYYADYDWVAFCQLFGPMVALPKGYPMYCRDIKQICDQLGNPPLPKPEKEIHHALVDALWIQDAHKFIEEFSKLRAP